MKIALLGDIALFGRYCLNRNENLHEQFISVRQYLSSFDLVIGNLEAPFAKDEQPIGGKSATIQAHPKNVAVLTALGITHVTLANNHIGDFGWRAYERTKSCLDAVGIGWFGTEGKQIHITQDGERIALLGYCSYNTNPSPVTSPSGIGLNYLDAQEVSQALERNAAKGFLSIISVHSGQEHVCMPSAEDVTFARALARVSNYIYYGHHPHVVQGHECVDGSAVFYSLGNFLFDDVYTPRDLGNPLIRLSEANKIGAIGTVEVRDGKILDSDVIPIYLGAERLLIGDEVPGFDIHELNAFLVHAGSTEYNQRRSVIIGEYINSRRELRDFKWYLRRLNLNSVGIILKARKNARLYRDKFSSKLPFLKDKL